MHLAAGMPVRGISPATTYRTDQYGAACTTTILTDILHNPKRASVSARKLYNSSTAAFRPRFRDITPIDRRNVQNIGCNHGVSNETGSCVSRVVEMADLRQKVRPGAGPLAPLDEGCAAVATAEQQHVECKAAECLATWWRPVIPTLQHDLCPPHTITESFNTALGCMTL